MAHTSTAPRRPVILIILDGFGANPSKANNAVAIADTPRLDHYFSRHPHTVLQASGRAVGLPDGQMGNSEVGHMTLGSGCTIRQDLVLIDDAIADGSFFQNPTLIATIQTATAKERPIHLMGLVSDGGVHSHIDHLVALIDLCGRHGARPQVHVITDGRDTPPRSIGGYLPALERALEQTGGAVATLSGRYYAMDRDHRWERTEMAWRAMVERVGREANDLREGIETAYRAGEDDEFIRPTVIAGGEAIVPGDPIIFFNFRKDRPRQMVTSLTAADFPHFDRHGFPPAPMTCLMEYSSSFGLPHCFDHEMPEVTVAQVISDAGLAQFHCAETEKYAHVTFFYNGGQNDPVPGEERALIPSPKVATYDLQPAMSAPEVADQVIAALTSGRFAFIVVNFANGDMVGHTAVREAVIEAVEVLDHEVGRVLDVAREAGYSIILTSDHGNCDELVDPVTGDPHTQHSLYPVPCLIADQTPWRLSIGAGIGSIAPTVLELMGLPVPKAMHSRTLLLGPTTP